MRAHLRLIEMLLVSSCGQFGGFTTPEEIGVALRAHLFCGSICMVPVPSFSGRQERCCGHFGSFVIIQCQCRKMRLWRIFCLRFSIAKEELAKTFVIFFFLVVPIIRRVKEVILH